MSPKKEKTDPLSPAVSTEPKNVQDLTVFVSKFLFESQPTTQHKLFSVFSSPFFVLLFSSNQPLTFCFPGIFPFLQQIT